MTTILLIISVISIIILGVKYYTQSRKLKKLNEFASICEVGKRVWTKDNTEMIWSHYGYRCLNFTYKAHKWPCTIVFFDQDKWILGEYEFDKADHTHNQALRIRKQNNIVEFAFYVIIDDQDDSNTFFGRDMAGYTSFEFSRETLHVVKVIPFIVDPSKNDYIYK